MTATIAAPPSARPAPATEPPSGRGALPRWRAAARLAARQVLRTWPTSLLITALVALPMAAVSGAVVVYESNQPTLAEEAYVEVGGTAAAVRIVGGSDPSAFQYLDDPDWVERDYDPETGEAVHEEGPMPEDAAALLPDGVETLSLTDAQVEAETSGGIGVLRAAVGDVGDPRLEGPLQLVDGERPSGRGEAAVSPGALQRLGVDLGDTLVLTDPDASYTITAVMKHARDTNDAQVVFLPAGGPLDGGSDPRKTTWYAIGWQPTAAEIYDLNREGAVVFAPELVANPGDGASPSFQYRNQDDMLMAGLLAASLAFSAYLVVLLAGAAFSVSARRQQRQLAMAASVGATRADIFRIVLLQGSTLGLIGGFLGAAAGIGIGAALLGWFDNGSAASPWGLHIPWVAIAVIVVFATLVGTFAALLPARAVASQQTIAALRGARRPMAPRASRPIWGSLLVFAGVGLSVASALWIPWIDGTVTDETHSTLMTIAIIGIVAGPILGQLGVILAGHWLLTVIARPLARLGLGARLAARDSAANPSRIVPAFGAIAACAFLASTALGAVGVSMGETHREWPWSAPLGNVAIELYADPAAATEDLEPRLSELAADTERLLAETNPSDSAVVFRQRMMWAGLPDVAPETPVVKPELQRYTNCAELPDGDPAWNTCAYPFTARMGEANGIARAIEAVAPEDLAVVLGYELTAAEREAYRDGAAVVTNPDWLNEHGELVLNTWAYRQVDPGAAEDALERRPTPQSSVALQTVRIDPDIPLTGAEVYLTPESAAALGVDVRMHRFVAAYDVPLTQNELDALTERVAALTPGTVVYDASTISPTVRREDGPPDPAIWYVLIVAATAVLVIGASSVALGLSRIERRPDDATLAAVGAAPRLRRSIAFWQGLIVAGFGCLTGAAAGILPVWGTTLANSHGTMFLSDVPWPALAALGLGLPLAIAAASWLVPPRMPDLTRRTAIA
ncbi:ABC transporter permease [Microbacterium sp. Marseille-Q6965]|uniref:ABC transporter permease n=1 Tax=Microbacterium sp. Marseille-Q6965 TaxID=2965072 RepID=UPI0021B7940F|nr:ABC transporter permease [Microbacterium sp. Marseille-Q6965]